MSSQFTLTSIGMKFLGAIAASMTFIFCLFLAVQIFATLIVGDASFEASRSFWVNFGPANFAKTHLRLIARLACGVGVYGPVYFVGRYAAAIRLDEERTVLFRSALYCSCSVYSELLFGEFPRHPTHPHYCARCHDPVELDRSAGLCGSGAVFVSLPEQRRRRASPLRFSYPSSP